MNKQRLLLLATFLDTVPDEKFNYNVWLNSREGVINDASLDDCGSSGCAMGWACTIPEFKEAGLDRNRGGEPTIYDSSTKSWMRGFSAAARFFDVPHLDAQILFSPETDGCIANTANLEDLEDEVHMHSPSRDASAKEVAEHIRNYVRVCEALAHSEEAS